MIERRMGVLAAALVGLVGCGGGGGGSAGGERQMGGGIIGGPLSLRGEVLTIAGTPGTASTAPGQFAGPWGITTDGLALYVTDRTAHDIRRVDLHSGTVVPFAGLAETTGSADGVGTAARFERPTGITTDGESLFVVDTLAQTIRKVALDGTVTTLAGLAGTTGTADGVGNAARFNNPADITTDGTFLYVCDESSGPVRKISIADGVVSTIAGGGAATGDEDSAGLAVHFFDPAGITTDGESLYVTEYFGNRVRRIVLATGRVSTIVPGSAGLDGPLGIATDGARLYIADRLLNLIRQYDLGTGALTLLAGGGSGLFADGMGAAAAFNSPSGITSDGRSLFVADSGNFVIRQIQ